MNKELNFKHFKKIHSDENMGILQHPKGHEIHISKKHLSPKMRGEIEAIPHMDEGGDVKPIQNVNWQKGSNSMQEAFKTPKKDVSDHAPKMAHGGLLYMPNGGQVPTEEEIRAAAVNSGMPGVTMNPLESLGANKPFAEAEYIKQGLDKKESDKQWADFDSQKAMAQKEAEQAKIDEANKYRTIGNLSPIPDVVQKPTMQSASFSQAPDQMQQAAGPQQPQDPYGMVAYQQAMTGGMNNMQQGLKDQQQADLSLAHNQQAAIEKQQASQAQLAKDFEQKHQELSAEMENAYQDLKAGHIDPKAYWGDMSAPGKIATIIGLIGGGIAGGVLHTENPAMKAMNDQIERNVRAQQMNLDKKQNVFNAMKTKYGSEIDATNAMRLMYATNMDNELKMAAAKAADPAAKARYEQASAQLAMQFAPMAQQMAMKQAMMQGVQTGHANPSMMVKMFVPEHDQAAVHKDINDAKALNSFRDTALNSFDQIAKLNTIGNNISSPIQTKKTVAALKEALKYKMTKELANKVSDADAHAFGTLFDTFAANPKTINTMKQQLDSFIQGQRHFSNLEAYPMILKAVDDSSSLHNDQGQSKFKTYAPVSGKK